MLISTDWILYVLTFAVFFLAAFWACSALDFSRFARIQDPRKIYMLMFLLSLSLAWLCTQAVFSLTVYRGY